MKYLLCFFALTALADPVKLSWENNHPERAAWSQALLKTVTEVLPQFDKANDSPTFCPKYKSLNDAQKTQVWSEVVIWTAYFESSWNPKTHYHEPTPLGYDSVGLLQLSYEDNGYKFCDLNRATKSLEDPIKNLNCGARIMAQLINRYGAVSKGTRGAAAYWSTLREGHQVHSIAAHSSQLEFCK